MDINSFTYVEAVSRMCSLKKGVVKSFIKFTGKHLHQSLFFNNAAGQACNFAKKETLAQVYSCKFCEIFKSTCFKKHIWATASTYVLIGFSYEINYSQL